MFGVTMEKAKNEIAGEITLSSNVGETLKKWRQIFNISQVDLAKYLGISVSTISDYESGRRKSPGVNVIKRFVNALFAIDMERGGEITKKLIENKKPIENYFELHEFAKGISVRSIVDEIEGRVITNEDLIDKKLVYGYTIIDSLKVILDMPFSYFPKIYGSVSERAFIFTGVSTGRSPMVAIRVSDSKPSAVILHGIDEVDKIAIKISLKQKIPLITTKIDIEKIKEKLGKI